MIEFREVAFEREGRRVLHGLSLTVPAGEILALVGRSGAGKTTILKLINRLLLPAHGVVEVEGRDTRAWDPYRLRRRTGYVLQEVGLFPHLTIAQNAGIVPRLEGWAPERIRSRVEELLDLVGLPAGLYGNRWPSELSGGERQRAGVARALALDPPILLMDEPFGSLDPLTRAEIHREFRRIHAAVRKTVILVTHDMGEAFALGDRLGVLADGQVIACDAPERVAASPDPRVQVFLDSAFLRDPGQETERSGAPQPRRDGTARVP
jgi:osmoprotectant transport system ATP-binding protein